MARFIPIASLPRSFSIGPRLSGHIARYSLDPRANRNTLDTYLTARGSYTTKHEFDIETDLSYVFYTGYAEGYGQPEWQWNAAHSARAQQAAINMIF